MIQDLYSFGDYSTEQMLDFVNTVREVRKDTGDEEFDENIILYQRPDAAEKPEEFVKTIPLEELWTLVPDALSGPIGLTVTKNLTLAQLERIGRDGDVFLKETIKVNLEIIRAQEPQNQDVAGFLDYIHASPAWQLSS